MRLEMQGNSFLKRQVVNLKSAKVNELYFDLKMTNRVQSTIQSRCIFFVHSYFSAFNLVQPFNSVYIQSSFFMHC